MQSDTIVFMAGFRRLFAAFVILFCHRILLSVDKDILPSDSLIALSLLDEHPHGMDVLRLQCEHSIDRGLSVLHSTRHSLNRYLLSQSSLDQDHCRWELFIPVPKIKYWFH